MLQDTASMCPVSVMLIYHWCSEKTLPHFRLGINGRRGKILIDVNDLERLLASRKVGGQPVEVKPPPKPKAVIPTFRHLKL